VRYFSIRDFRNCPIPGKTTPPIFGNLTFHQADSNKVGFEGTIIINEKVDGDISLIFEPARCNPDMKTCTKLTALKFSDLCKKFKDKNSFMYNFVEKINPPIVCPLKPGIYTVPLVSADLSILTMFTREGSVYLPIMKFVVNDTKRKTKKVVLCMQFEATVTTSWIKP
jgi:hypothetical protein